MLDKFDEIRKDLKTKYFGIDKQIDEIVGVFKTWYSTKDFLIRPTIFNLVGPSGIGKTAVIKDIIDKLDLSEDLTYFKFNNQTTFVSDELVKINKTSQIFVLDELQYLKTILENGQEQREKDERGFQILWDLMDGGIINLSTRICDPYMRYYTVKYTLNKLIKYGATYENGIFTHPNMLNIISEFYLGANTIYDIDFYKTKYDKNRNGVINFKNEHINNRTVVNDPPINITIKSPKSGVQIQENTDTSTTQSTILNILDITFKHLFDWVNYRVDTFKDEDDLAKYINELKSRHFKFL